MSDRVAFSDETETKPTTTFSQNWTRQAQPLGMDREKLSARSRLIFEGMGREQSENFSLREIASSRGRDASWVQEQLDWLNTESALQAGSFFPLSDEEYASLKADIEKSGVKVPVMVGRHIPIIDGLNRWSIACALGIEMDVPLIFVDGLTKSEEHELGIRLNTQRRQLSFEQRCRLVEVELLRDPERSDRYVAGLCGVNHHKVAQIRRVLREEQETDDAPLVAAVPAPVPVEREPVQVGIAPTSPELDVEEPEYRRGRDEKMYPVRPVEPKPPQRKSVGFVTCSHGQVHELFLSGDIYEAVATRD